MKQITLLGATGMLGSNLLQKALSSGMKVKVLARNKAKLGELAKAIEVVEGNYFDHSKLQKALEGSEVIISTIAPVKNDLLSSADEEKYIHSLAFIIQQMEANQQLRWLSISNAGAKGTMEKLPLARKLLRVALKAESKSTIHLKDQELQLLEQSHLQWTCLRPPTIKENLKGQLVTDEVNFLGSSVDLNQLTDFIIHEITNNEWINKAPIVATK